MFTFFRFYHFFGLPVVKPHANAIQLLLTLKMVGLAFEKHDTHIAEQGIQKGAGDTQVAENTAHVKLDSHQLKLKFDYQKIEPTFTDILLYSYCYIGLLTGPYFKFRTYHDMIHNKNTAHLDTYRPVITKLQKLPLYLLCYLVGTYHFDVQYAVTAECYAQPFWYRLGYSFVCFTIMRIRFYIAWILSECICISAGLGAYPTSSKPRCGIGPTDFEKLQKTENIAPNAVVYNFETVHNIDEYGCDFATTLREGMRCWNMTVQYWLAHHVYKRITFKNSQIKVAITMLVSAYWHGIHPGYYLSFLTIPMCLLAEDLLLSTFHKQAAPKQQRRLEWFIWFVKMRALDYMAMGFLLLSFEKTVGYWSSISFAVHVWTVGFIIICYLCQLKRGKPKTDMSLSQRNEAKKTL